MTLESLPHVSAKLRYYTPPKDGALPWMRRYLDPGDPIDKPFPTNVELIEKTLPIYDLRALEDPAAETSIDTTGFQVVDKKYSPTSMKYEDWSHEDKVKSVYYDEVKALLKNVTGASRVEIFDHTIRRGERPEEATADTPNSRKPLSLVHVDQTPASGRNRVYRHTGGDAERLLSSRAQLVNVWRPLRGPVLDMPLAYADARTLEKKDLIPSKLLYRDQPEGETFQVAFDDKHRWYYLSEMGPQEAVLLKCWSSPDDRNTNGITPHSAFVDERYQGKPDVELRQSIEVRALIFFEPQA